MACSCNQDPCFCNSNQNPNKFCRCNATPCSCQLVAPGCSCMESPCICACLPPPVPQRTFCDRDRKNNVWVEGVQDEDGNGGICMLDTMSRAQVISVIECDPVARADLKRVTSDPCLLELAETVKSLPTEEPGDTLQRELGRQAESIPFYAWFRGNPPFAQ